MTATEIQAAKNQAHKRLLNAVISYNGATMNSSKAEFAAALVELDAATEASQHLLYSAQEGV